MTKAGSSRLFRDRLCSREPLIGAFQKISHYQATEILAFSGLDYIVLDTEHAVFDRRELDACLMAARSGNIAAIVRLPDSSDASILSVLDMGADGIVVPHVSDAATAERVAAASHYASHRGTRGYSNSPRAGGYGRRTMQDHIRMADSSVVVICQIEDTAAVKAIDAIARTQGVHGLLVGPADLALSYGCAPNDPVLANAISMVAKSASSLGMAAGVAIPDEDQAASLIKAGFSFFVAGSDQSMMAQHASAIASRFHKNKQP